MTRFSLPTSETIALEFLPWQSREQIEAQITKQTEQGFQVMTMGQREILHPDDPIEQDPGNQALRTIPVLMVILARVTGQITAEVGSDLAMPSGMILQPGAGRRS